MMHSGLPRSINDKRYQSVRKLYKKARLVYSGVGRCPGMHTIVNKVIDYGVKAYNDELDEVSLRGVK